jgi:hypothetical protein
MTIKTATRLIALSLTVVALTIPSVASAVPQPALGTYHATERPDPQPASPSVIRLDSGFSWGDAALGGAAVLAIVIVGSGGALVFQGYRNGGTRVHTS